MVDVSTAARGAASAATQVDQRRLKDFFARHGRLREDGLMVHDLYLVEVKKPEESKYPWDYYKVLATIPGNEAFKPQEGGGCPLVDKK